MFNLVKSDLYRMVKSKSTYVIFVITLLIIVIQAITNTTILREMNKDMSAAMEMYDITETGENTTELYDEEEGSITIGNQTNMVTEADMIRKGEAPFAYLLVSGMNNMILFLTLIIFVVVFTNADQKNGFIKNLAGGMHRYKITVSKFICMTLYAAAAFIGAAAVILIVSKIMLEVKYDVMKVVLGDVGDIFQALGVEFLGHLAVMTVVLAIVTFTRSTAASMAVGIIFGSGLPTIVYQLGTLLLQKFFDVPKSFYIGDYVPSGIVMSFRLGIEQSVQNRMLIVGFAYTIIFLALSMFIIHKKDVK